MIYHRILHDLKENESAGPRVSEGSPTPKGRGFPVGKGSFFDAPLNPACKAGLAGSAPGHAADRPASSFDVEATDTKRICAVPFVEKR
jgi:hypothetical protein